MLTLPVHHGEKTKFEVDVHIASTIKKQKVINIYGHFISIQRNGITSNRHVFLPQLM